MSNNEPITFEVLCATLDDVTVIRDGTEAYARCPWCGKPPHDERGKLARHFHFGQFGAHEYGKCFVCEESGGYLSIYRKVTGEYVNYSPRRQQEPKQAEPEQPPLWKEYATELLASYQKRMERFDMWNTYKPISMRTIREYRLGVGILPYVITHKPSDSEYEVMTFAPNGKDPEVIIRSKKTGVERRGHEYAMQSEFNRICGTYVPIQHRERLIVPTFDDDGELIALHGRSMDPNEKRYKWMPAYPGCGNPIFGIEYVRPGDTVVLCENRVDAAMVHQLDPKYRGVALGTARTIRDNEIKRLMKRDPAQVLVMLDNDLAGQASGPMLKRLIEEYEAEHGRDAPTPLYGYKCLEALRAHGMVSILFDCWEKFDAPAKAGVDWVIEQDIAEEQAA